MNNSKIYIFEIPNIDIFGRSETRGVSEIQKSDDFRLLNFRRGEVEI